MFLNFILSSHVYQIKIARKISFGNLLARKITDKLNPLPMDVPSSITLQITGSSSSSNNEEFGLELNGNV